MAKKKQAKKKQAKKKQAKKKQAKKKQAKKKQAKKTGARKRAPKKRRSAAAAANPALEAQIAAAPDDPAPYLVYGDWLQQQGDPRGELVAMQAARLASKGPELARLLVAEREHLDAHAKHFYGPLIRYRAARQAGLEWFCGFVRALDGSAFKATAELFAHPSARFLQRLYLQDVELDHESAPPLLTHLGTSQAADLRWVWSLPRLRELRVGGGWDVAELGEVRHEGLRLLHLHAATPAALDRLAEARLPRLETLSLTGLRDDRAGRLAAITARLPRLARLAVGLSPGLESGAYEDLADVAPRVTTLVLNALDRATLQSIRELDFARVGELEVRTVFDADVRNTIFDGELLPELPALRTVRLGYPSDLVGYYRGFSRSALARRIEALSVSVGKPGAGRALVEGRFERLTRLDLGFDPEVGAEYIQSALVLGSAAFPAVTELRLGPTRHLEPLAGTPLGDRVERLTVPVDRDRDARELLAQARRFPRLQTLVVEGTRRLSPEVLTELLSLELEVVWPGQLAGRV